MDTSFVVKRLHAAAAVSAQPEPASARQATATGPGARAAAGAPIPDPQSREVAYRALGAPIPPAAFRQRREQALCRRRAYDRALAQGASAQRRARQTDIRT